MSGYFPTTRSRIWTLGWETSFVDVRDHAHASGSIPRMVSKFPIILGQPWALWSSIDELLAGRVFVTTYSTKLAAASDHPIVVSTSNINDAALRAQFSHEYFWTRIYSRLSGQICCIMKACFWPNVPKVLRWLVKVNDLLRCVHEFSLLDGMHKLRVNHATVLLLLPGAPQDKVTKWFPCCDGHFRKSNHYRRSRHRMWKYCIFKMLARSVGLISPRLAHHASAKKLSTWMVMYQGNKLSRYIGNQSNKAWTLFNQ